jgi:lysozyme family protein
MAKFDEAVKPTLKTEAGYNNSSKDLGGETYAGISRVNNPHWPGWEYVDGATKAAGLKHIDPTKEECAQVDALLRQVPVMAKLIRDFYKAEYWDPLSLDAEPDQEMANMVFDTAVNMGVSKARAIYAESVKGLKR